MFAGETSKQALPTTHEPGAEAAAWPVAPFQRFGGMASLFSATYISQPVCNCLRLLAHRIRCAHSFALDNAGSSSAASIAIMAMTTNNSIKVNARRKLVMIRIEDTGKPDLFQTILGRCPIIYVR